MANAHDFEEVRANYRRQAELAVDRGLVPTHPSSMQGSDYGKHTTVHVKQFRLEDESDCAAYADILTKAAAPGSGVIIRKEDMGRDGGANAVVVLIWLQVDMEAAKKSARERAIDELQTALAEAATPSSTRQHPKLVPDSDNTDKDLVDIAEVKRALLKKHAQPATLFGPDALDALFPEREDHPQSDAEPMPYHPTVSVVEEFMISETAQAQLRREFEAEGEVDDE